MKTLAGVTMEGSLATTDVLPMPTTARPRGVHFDADASYSQADVARAFGVDERSVQRWRKRRHNRFPRPFVVGRVPYWRGQTIVNWMNAQQERAA